MKLNPDKGKSPEQLAWERGYAQGLANAKALYAPQAKAAGQELPMLIDLLARWEDENGAMAAIMDHEWAELCEKVRKACIEQSPRSLRKAWQARAALAQRQPLTVPHPGSPEAKAMIDSELALRDWPANHFNAARAGYEACRKLAGLDIGATTGEQR